MNPSSNALLDSGALVNVMAEHIYKEFINKSLTSTTNLLNSVSNQPINCKGVVTTSVNVDAECVFYAHTKERHDIILGRACAQTSNSNGRTAISTSLLALKELTFPLQLMLLSPLPYHVQCQHESKHNNQRNLKSTMGHTQGTI